ncbi:MAG: MATE family efflux transporter [Lachnospiraceae bacterium]|nr:MATE family efflux transporter [Lachnospiraceae bacterium]
MKKDMDMRHGPLIGKILWFAIPLACSSILQQLFNAADVAVVGRFAGSEALAAVGANGSLINLIINLFVGLSVGANVVISTYIGRDDKKGASRAVHTAIVLALISGVILVFIGEVIAPEILKLMDTPTEILELATTYLKIYFLGMPFIILYNYEASILRSKGDTTRPLIVLTIAGVINVVLNLILVIGFHLSVAGVAIGTLVSNAVSSIILFYILLHEEEPFRIHLKELRLDKKIVGKIFSIGIPSGVQGMVFSFSNVMIQAAMNSLGTIPVAATTAALNLEYASFFILSSFSQAGVSFIGQNYGAGLKDRCKKVVRTCWGLAVIFTMAYSFLTILFAPYLTQLFTDDLEVLELAVLRIKVILSVAFLNATIEVLSGAMRGLGKSLVPALIAVVGICGTRLIWIYTAFRIEPTYRMLIYVYPISWLVTVTGIIIAYFILRKKYLSTNKSEEK